MDPTSNPRLPAGLTRAIRAGDLASIKRQVDAAGAGVLAQTRADGCGCLHLAAAANQPAVIRWLLAAGADPRQRNGKGQIALGEAVRRGHIEAADTLLFSLPVERRRGAILAALNERQDAMAAWLARITYTGADVPDQALGAIAVHSGCPQTLRALIGCGLTEESSHSSLGSLLHITLMAPALACTRVLLDAGFNENAADAQGCTALHLAAEDANPQAVALLLSAGANPELRDDSGDTALAYVKHLHTKAGRCCREALEAAMCSRALRRQADGVADASESGPGI